MIKSGKENFPSMTTSWSGFGIRKPFPVRESTASATVDANPGMRFRCSWDPLSPLPYSQGRHGPRGGSEWASRAGSPSRSQDATVGEVYHILRLGCRSRSLSPFSAWAPSSAAKPPFSPRYSGARGSASAPAGAGGLAYRRNGTLDMVWCLTQIRVGSRRGTLATRLFVVDADVVGWGVARRFGYS